MDHLLKYSWPGNVRELMNAIERGVVLSRSNEYLDLDDLSLISDTISSDDESSSNDILPDGLPLDEVEKATILRTLKSSGGNKSETSRRLGITRRTLHKKLKKYGVMP